MAIIALLVMSLSDSSAALIGIKFGKTRLFNKTLEGSLSFLITTYVIISLLSPASIMLSPHCAALMGSGVSSSTTTSLEKSILKKIPKTSSTQGTSIASGSAEQSILEKIKKK